MNDPKSGVVFRDTRKNPSPLSPHTSTLLTFHDVINGLGVEPVGSVSIHPIISIATGRVSLVGHSSPTIASMGMRNCPVVRDMLLRLVQSLSRIPSGIASRIPSGIAPRIPSRSPSRIPSGNPSHDS